MAIDYLTPPVPGVSPAAYLGNPAMAGDVGDRLLAANMDPRVLRPYVETAPGPLYGRSLFTKNERGKDRVFATNAPATLTKDAWVELDRAVMRVSRNRLKYVSWLRNRGLVYNIPNGMGKTIFETQTMSGAGSVSISMDALRQSDRDRPLFNLTGLPLPIIHSDFFFSLREIEVSRNTGAPLDTTMAEEAARNVSEEVERLALGVSTAYDLYQYGGYTIYGLTDFPSRLTKVLSNPATAPGWTPSTTLREVLAMKQQSMDNYKYGPWILFASSDWDLYLDDDYSDVKGDASLRDKLKGIEGIDDVVTLDFLPAKSLILVEANTATVREVIAMEMTTVQWDSSGGLAKNFKVMTIMIPQYRADYNNRTGIVHGAYV